MSCCGGGHVNGDEPVPREHSQYEDLRRRLSGIMPPLDVDWAAEATVNLSGVSGTQPGPSQMEQRTSSVLGTFERRQSVSGAVQRQQSGDVLQWTDSRKLLEVAIAMEQIEPPMASIPEGRSVAGVADQGGEYGWDAEWEEMQRAEQRLQGRLFKLKLEHCIMDGDGNCQFRSISYGLYGTQRHHPYVRRRAVEYIRQHPQDFDAFLGEDLSAYLEQMRQERTWGDELTLRATCEALSVVVNVISSDESNWFLRYLPRSTRPKHECFLTYIAPVHYNAVRRQHTGDRLRHSFGRQHSQLSRAVSTYQRQYGFPQSPHHLASAGLVG